MIKLMKAADIKLGKKYRDRVTGFAGVATGTTKWLTGCDTVILQPPVGADGKYMDNAQFDITRVDLVDEPKVKLHPGRSGGPQPKAMPTR
jgi:hypothetical protein